jgi:signal transduction histidine kinase
VTVAERIAPLCRLVLLFRLVAVNVAVAQVLGAGERAADLLLGLGVAAVTSYLMLRRWERLGPLLLRRPILLSLDVAVSLAVFGVLGAGSPIYLYTLGTALLAGVLYGTVGAAVFSGCLLLGYYALVAPESPGDLEATVTLPVLYPLLAAGGAAVRELLDRQAATETALRGAERAAAASDERARVAREMHDSLGKTLYGIALGARALARKVADDAPAASAAAQDLSGAAQLAAEEARGLIADLRSDALDLPLGAALAKYVAEWSEDAGVPAETHGEAVDLPNPSTRYELFCIVKEALRNVDRHAAASHVAVRLEQRGDHVELSVADDGVGIGASGDPRALEKEGHYGLVGMVERAERVGATMHIDGVGGTTVRVRVPAGDVRTPEPWVVGGTPT